MHYRIKGLTIKTENAAKPVNQPSQFVLEWIANLPREAIVLDYGCGKFRYTIPLSQRVRFVYAVDSIEQVERTQIINTKVTTLRQYAHDYLKNVIVCDVNSNDWKKIKFDYILCANVLQIVPIKRERRRILEIFLNILKRDGKVFVCTQYHNSYFNTYKTNPNAIPHLDGWLVRSRNGPSFYGIITAKELAKLCIKAGLTNIDTHTQNGSAFVLASR